MGPTAQDGRCSELVRDLAPPELVLDAIEVCMAKGLHGGACIGRAWGMR